MGLASFIDLWSVDFRTVDMAGMGTPKERVLFMDISTTGVDRRTGLPLRIIARLSGDAVGCLVVLECDGVYYALLVKQLRVPVGKELLEIVAGMMDSSSDPTAKMIEELEEEAGLVIPRSSVSALAIRPLYTSPGRSDEAIHLYACTTKVTPEKLAEFRGQIHGARDESERTELVVIPLNEVHEHTDDMKTALAVLLYHPQT